MPQDKLKDIIDRAVADGVSDEDIDLMVQAYRKQTPKQVPRRRGYMETLGEMADPTMLNERMRGEGEAVKAGANAYLDAGPRSMTRGAARIARGEVAGGARDVLRGGLVTAAPIAVAGLPYAIAAAPGATLTSLAGGVASGAIAQPIAEKTASALGATDDQAGLVGDVTGLAAGLAGGSLARRALDAFPSRARAGAAFQEVMKAAQQEPVDTGRAGDVALRIYDMAERGQNLPRVVSKFVSYATNPKKDDLTYEVARDFYSSISRLSAADQQHLTPAMRAEIGKLRVALNDALEAAARRVGQDQTYRSAMREYARASAMRDTARDIGTKTLKYAIPGGLTYYGLEQLRKIGQ